LTKRRLVSIICPSSRQASDITLSRSLITEGLLRLPDINLASRSSSPVQDIALSRRQHGFKSRTGRHSISVIYSRSITQRQIPGNVLVTFSPISVFKEPKTASSLPTAPDRKAGERCWYRAAILRSSCPSNCATVCMSAPLILSHDAAV
jgi:hypothetical protein